MISGRPLLAITTERLSVATNTGILTLFLPLVTAATALGRVAKSPPCLFALTTQSTTVPGLGSPLAQNAGELDET